MLWLERFSSPELADWILGRILVLLGAGSVDN